LVSNINNYLSRSWSVYSGCVLQSSSTDWNYRWHSNFLDR